MADVALIIDSCCDLPADVVSRSGARVLRFPYALDGVERLDDFGVSMPHAAFYDAMRAGSVPTTAQVPMVAFLEEYRRCARESVPGVHLAFSSALSSTYDAAQLARDTVLAESPDADITIVDTRSASIAEGLLVYEAAKRVAGGAGKDELLAWVAAALPGLNGWFTIEDLEHLRRGGRISSVAAAAGGMLDIKPVLRIDAEGRLVVAKNVRGRGKSLRALADIAAERIGAARPRTLVVGHADSEADAARLRELLAERVEADEVLTTNVGPVIGTHTGPGMVAVAFFGDER